MADTLLTTGIIVLDLARRVDFANRHALHLFACRHPAELQKALATLELDAALDSASQAPQELLVGTDPRRIQLQINGCERGWMILAYDAAVLDTLERCLRSASEARARSRMCGTLLHNVKGPIHAMTLALDVLTKTLRAGDGRELRYVDAVRNELARLQPAVEALLPHTRGFDEAIKLDVASLIGEVTKMIRVEAAMREVVFKLSLADNMHARAGRRELKHAFACVLLDVLEATPEGGEIEIKAGDEDGWIRVTISSASARVEKTHDDAIDFHVARDTARACGGELYAESLRRVCFKLPASPGAAGTS